MIFITDKPPTEVPTFSILLKGIELVFNLSVDIFTLTLILTAFCFDDPDGSIFFLYNIIGIEKPLLLNTVQIYDGEILLAGIAILVYPVDIDAVLTVLFKELLAGAAYETGREAGGITAVCAGKIPDLIFYIGIVTEKILLRKGEDTLFGVKDTGLKCHVSRDIPEFFP